MTGYHFRIGEVPVPAMALGTMYFGTQVPTARAVDTLDAAYEVGARFWDTANNYAFWAGGVGDESETVIGAWLNRRGSTVRDEVVLATKVGARPRTHESGLDDVLGLSRQAIRGQVHEGLTRLRTDYVDVLFAHVDDRTVGFEETLEAFGELLNAGLARAIAASNLTPDRLAQAVATPGAHHYQALQQRFTYLIPEPGTALGPHVLLDEETTRMCGRHGLTRLGYAPLLSGAYTRPDRRYPDGYVPSASALRALREVADTHALDAGQAVLAWMVNRDSPVIPVVGVSSPEQAVAAWEAVGTSLTVEETTRLDSARTASN